jgi:small subunit ribosomal protein S2
MKELLEAGVHFGHQTRRWNPRMKPYIFGKRNGIYIIDLQKTVELFREAADFVHELGARGKQVLFVGTKRQAAGGDRRRGAALRQFFVTHRWLGGTLTNFVTIRGSIERLKELEQRPRRTRQPADQEGAAALEREHDKMHRNLEGIRDMEGLPDACSSSIPSAKTSPWPRPTSSASR